MLSKVRPINIFSAILILLLALNISGCAGKRSRLRGKALYDLKKKTVSIDGEDYVSLSLMCSLYGLKWDYDPISYRVLLKKDGHKAIVMANTSSFILDGRYYTSLKPVILYDDNIYIPFSIIEDKFDRVFNPAYYREEPAGIHKIKKVVIDAGHGGKDPGASGRYGLKEKDVVLDISRRLRDILESEGFEVIMTRDNDTFVSLRRRTEISNDAKPDFFVSIHANAARSRAASGFEVYYLSDAMDDNARAVAAAENAVWELDDEFKLEHSNSLDAIVWDLLYDEYRLEAKEMASSLCDALQCDAVGRNRGVKSARFYVLKGVRVPSVLIEVGFISNTTEESRLKNSSFRQRIAQAIADGIVNYKQRYEETDGFTN
jgi:N-acetylmuramoyl-L-alanine amidase